MIIWIFIGCNNIYINIYFKFTANTFTKFIINNTYELEIKKLKDELNTEKNKNIILLNENKRLNDIINNMKKINNDLNNQIKLLETQLNQLKLDLQNSKSNINNNMDDLNNLIMPMVPGEKIMAVIFNSQGIQYVCNWGLPCKNTNLFVRLEEILNNNFPELKKHDTYFMVNTRRIKRFQTLEENNIKNNDIINVFLIDA